MEKPILITGASRGLGAALAEHLCATHPIIAVARTVGGLEDLDDRIKARGGSATLAPIDVTDPDAVAHLCASIAGRWGGLAAWAHTAVHAAPLTPATMTGAKDLAKSVALNVTATADLMGKVAPLLDASSAALFFDDACAGHKFFGMYGATKAAQIALARSWQAEANSTSPTVHILTPAPMATAVRARFYPGEDRASLAKPMVEAARLAALAGLS